MHQTTITNGTGRTSAAFAQFSFFSKSDLDQNMRVSTSNKAQIIVVLMYQGVACLSDSPQSYVGVSFSPQ